MINCPELNSETSREETSSISYKRSSTMRNNMNSCFLSLEKRKWKLQRSKGSNKGYQAKMYLDRIKICLESRQHLKQRVRMMRTQTTPSSPRNKVDHLKRTSNFLKLNPQSKEDLAKQLKRECHFTNHRPYS